MKNSGANVVSFTSDGSVILKGVLSANSNPAASDADEFIVKNSNGVIVAIINFNTGNMDIKGNLLANQDFLIPNSNSNFVVKDSSGTSIDYIDDSGNFFLKGNLTQNGNP
jgi:hypothetical protein